MKMMWLPPLHIVPAIDICFGGTGETGRAIQHTISQAWQLSVLPGNFITIRIEQSAEMRYDEIKNVPEIIGLEGRRSEAEYNTLGRYTYVKNDPVNFIDPSGRSLKSTYCKYVTAVSVDDKGSASWTM